MQQSLSSIADLGKKCDGNPRLNVTNQSVPAPGQLAKVALDLDAMLELVRLTEEGPLCHEKIGT